MPRIVSVTSTQHARRFAACRWIFLMCAVALVLPACPPGSCSPLQTEGSRLVNASGLSQQDQAYDARRAFEEDTAGSRNPAALARLAAVEEVYADRAGEAYSRLADALPPGSQERLHALESGFRLSLRDADLKRAASFAAALESEGHPEYGTQLGERHIVQDDALVPGGMEAFAYIAQIKPGIPSSRFLAEYALQVVKNVCSNGCMHDPYTAAIQSYFATVAQLEGMGRRVGDSVSLTLSLTTKDERNQTQNVLSLLGLQLRSEKGRIRLDRGEKQSQGRKQDLLTALQIDEVGLEEALQAGKPFTFELHDDPVPVYPSMKMWKEAFPKQDQRQFFLMLLRDPQMARLYVGISTLDRRTMQALIGTGGLYWFLGRPADLLILYGASFAVEGTHAAVPGGKAAAPVWSQMAGASTDQPAAFYQALLQAKTPTLLVYFYALSHLDSRHQAFFTASLARARRFYAFFATLPESQPFSNALLTESPFSELLRSVPIDEQGHVAFPGSPELWEVAQGSAVDDKTVGKMMQKVKAAVTPDLEDELLLHLVETRYQARSAAHSELDNFLAVAHIDAHRTKLLDEESALLLAQHYSNFGPSYAYFAELTAIDEAGFRRYFRLVDGMRKQPLLEQNEQMGQLSSLIEWLVLMKRRGVLNDAEAGRLFAELCGRLSQATGATDRTEAVAAVVQAILARCGSGSWDEAIRSCLLGPSANAPDARGKDYGVVLHEQRAPSLESLRAIVTAATAALAPAGGARIIAIPQKIDWPSVPPPKDTGVIGKEKEALLLYDPARLQKLIRDWNEVAAGGAQDAKAMQAAQRLAPELLQATGPQWTLALATPVYAYFFRSGDRAVAADPLLTRKHRYFEFVVPAEQSLLVRESRFVSASDGFGSYMQGGFAQFALASGFAAASGWKQGGRGGNAVIAEQIAAIRSALWESLCEDDQRLLTLRILAAREWIAAAAQDPKFFASLSEETFGLLSLSRRAALLNGIEEREWQQVWASVTLPDLFRLGSNYLKRNPTGPKPSAVVMQLATVSARGDDTALDILARIPAHILGCSHTHLVSDEPYEEYERKRDPTFLAERTAEFKFFLAYRADSLGIQPAELSNVAERLAARAFSASQMTDEHDWRSLLAAYGSITTTDLQRALQP